MGRKWRKAGLSRGGGMASLTWQYRGRDAIPVGIEYRDGKLEAIYLPDGFLSCSPRGIKASLFHGASHELREAGVFPAALG